MVLIIHCETRKNNSNQTVMGKGLILHLEKQGISFSKYFLHTVYSFALVVVYM